jgi:hypothetical protein
VTTAAYTMSDHGRAGLTFHEADTTFSVSSPTDSHRKLKATQHLGSRQVG